MKKIFIVILTIFTALFLNSCSKSDVMLSGDWWTIIPDEVGSGDENVVIRFDNSSSTVNFAVKSTNKDEKNYYIRQRVKASSESTKRTALNGRSSVSIHSHS